MRTTPPVKLINIQDATRKIDLNAYCARAVFDLIEMLVKNQGF